MIIENGKQSITLLLHAIMLFGAGIGCGETEMNTQKYVISPTLNGVDLFPMPVRDEDLVTISKPHLLINLRSRRYQSKAQAS
jgi:hypothetical protein